VRLFLSGLVSPELANGYKNQFVFEVGAAMADDIVSPLEWALTQQPNFALRTRSASL
jgi:hypothetical protein